MLELCTAAARFLEGRKLLKGSLAHGRYAPKKGAELATKTREILPWTPADEVHDITAVSALGAMCVMQQATPNHSNIQAAIARCHAVLEGRGIVWTLEGYNDAPHTTKEDMMALLHEAAGS